MTTGTRNQTPVESGEEGEEEVNWTTSPPPPSTQTNNNDEQQEEQQHQPPPPKTTTTTTAKRNGGVADYFAILGVGDDLIWKYAQKQREKQQQQQEMQQLIQETQNTTSFSSLDGDMNDHEKQQQKDQESIVSSTTVMKEEEQQEQEDQAALMERFYREIIDVTILTEEYKSPPQHFSSTASASINNATSSTIVPVSSVLSSDTADDGTNSLASSRVQGTTTTASVASNDDTTNNNYNHSQQPEILLPSPSSHSEATTTVATTVLSSSDTALGTSAAHQPTTSDGTTSAILHNALPLEKNGFTLVSQTLPPRQQQHYQQQQPPLSFPHGLGETPMSHQSAYPWNTHPNFHPHHPYHHNATKNRNLSSYIFDANLDPVGGLRDQVCTTILQWEESSNGGGSDHHHNHHSASSGVSVGGSSAASFQGLKRKFWKRLKGGAGSSGGDGSGAIDTSTSFSSSAAMGPSTNATNSKYPHNPMKFYIGYKRRTPDQEHVPAIANIALYYVGIPRYAGFHTSHSSHTNHQDAPTSPGGGGGGGGLAGRVAAAAGHVLFERYRSHGPDPHDPPIIAENVISHFVTVDLNSKLPLPDGFDEWCIPEEYQQLKIPKSSTHPGRHQKDRNIAGGTPRRDTTRQKTVLVASPSHGRIEKSNQCRKDDDDEILSLGNEEAVEAYVDKNASAPLSPIGTVSPPSCDGLTVDTTTVDSSNNSDKILDEDDALFVPQVLSDVPMDCGSDDGNGEVIFIPILAVRRQRTREEERFHEDAGIVDLAVSFCDKNGSAVLPVEQEDVDDMMMDEGEDELNLLSKTSWSEADPTPKDSKSSLKIKKRPDSTKARIRRVQKALGSPTILARHNVPFGFADQAFATSVLDRFPVKNYKGLPLPSEELPMFCYPTGCRLHRARFSDAPLAQYYGFVVKNERGDSIYVSCVSFMEPLARDKVNQLANLSEKRRRTSLAHRRFCEKRDRRRSKKTIFEEKKDSEGMPFNDYEPDFESFEYASDDEEEEEQDNFIVTSFDTMTTFENKTICLVSRHPFWTSFRRFLSHLHILSGSSSDIPLERCISHLLLSVPLPRPGGPSVIVPLPALNQPMILSFPPLKDFPLVDLPYNRLVACLDIPTIVTVVLGFLALERKVRTVRRQRL